MKRIITLSMALSFLVTCFAGTNVVIPKTSSDPNANQVLIPLGKNGEKVSLMTLSHMKAKELESLTGHQMKWTDKLAFKMAQRQMKKSINVDGTINSKKLSKARGKAAEAEISKGLYIVLAIFGLAWIAMGVMDDWSGNNWWVNLILTLLFWLPGFIHALIKMKDYYN